MFLFGHLGIGTKLVSPCSKGLSYRLVLLGTILPDLLDKAFYYGLSLATGKHGAELGWIAGTRGLGHTALFLLILSLVAIPRRSRVLAALGLGIASHLLLDNLTDYFIGTQGGAGIVALLWPLKGLQFPVMPYQNLGEQLRSGAHPFVLGAEIVGILLLSWDFWKSSHRREIVGVLGLRRMRRLLKGGFADE